MWVWLRLKLLADVGLVGLPNAGKSTFLNSVSNAAAKVGDYPFTTLRPQLGVVRHKGREFVLADIPGLIEGAAEGAGVGDRFLGHVERTRLLLHLVDASGDDPAEAWRIVRDELASYGAGLDLKPEIVALTKADMLDAKKVKKIAGAREASGSKVYPVSAPLGEGIEPLLDTIVAGARRGRLRSMRIPSLAGRGRRYEARDHRWHRVRRSASDRRGARRRPPGQGADPPRPAAAQRRLMDPRQTLRTARRCATWSTDSDAIIHVAGLISARDAAGFEQGNVDGTLAMLAAATAGGVHRFVNVSSLAAREPKLSLYGASKARAEELVERSGLDWAIVRPPAVYGPGDKETLELFRMARLGLIVVPPRGPAVAAPRRRPRPAAARADRAGRTLRRGHRGRRRHAGRLDPPRIRPRARSRSRQEAHDRPRARRSCCASPPTPTSWSAAPRPSLPSTVPPISPITTGWSTQTRAAARPVASSRRDRARPRRHRRLVPRARVALVAKSETISGTSRLKPKPPEHPCATGIEKHSAAFVR